MPALSASKKVPALVAFGKAVRKRRTELGYSQEAFGDACEMDRSYMGGIERGAHNPALLNILRIVEALDLQPSEFFRALDRGAKNRQSDALK